MKRSRLGYKRYSPDVNNPYNIIPSNRITMRDVDFPVLGIDDLGNSQMMYPGGEYQFPGNEVLELPQFGKGGLKQWFDEKWVDVKTGKKCGRSGKDKKGRPYPACRPSRRVNETTPKTTGEMSAKEKAKFKKKKTSGKRIDYNHKRMFGGSLPTYQNQGEVVSLSPSDPRYAEYYNRLNDDVVLADPSGKTAGRIFLDEVDVVADRSTPPTFNFPGYTSPAAVQDQIALQTPFRFTEEGIAAGESYQEYQDYINSLPYDQRPGYIQPTISEYVPPSTGEWWWDKISHPMTSLGYVMRGQTDIMPDRVGNSPDRNTFDYAVDIINPATYINTVGDLYENLSEGDILGAGLDAVTLLPAVPTAAKQVKKAIPAIKRTTRNIPAKINPNYYNPTSIAKGNPNVYYRTAGKDAYEDFVSSGFLRTQAEVTDNPIMGLLGTKREIDEIRGAIKGLGGRGQTYWHPTKFRAPYFSRGRTASMTSGGYDYLFQPRPEFIGDDAFSSGQMEYLHGMGNSTVPVGGYGIMDPMQRGAANFDVFKKNWWSGYKPIKQDGGEASKVAAQQATGYRPQATISQYEEPAWYEKAADYLASPMTAFSYIVQGEDLPDRIPINAENRNPYDMAFDIINPAAWAAYAESADKNLEEGNYLAAGFDALGAIPVIPSSVSQGRNVIKVGAKSSPQLYKQPYRPLNRMLDMEGASSFVTEKPMTFTHVSRNPALTLDDIKTTEAFTVGKRPKGGKRAIRDVAAGVSDPRNAPAGFYTISPEEGVRATLAGYATPGSGAYRYSFEMPAGLRVLDFPGGTSVMSTGNLQEALDMGYDVIRGNDMGVGVEFLPLNKSKMSGFRGELVKKYGGRLIPRYQDKGQVNKTRSEKVGRNEIPQNKDLFSKYVMYPALLEGAAFMDWYGPKVDEAAGDMTRYAKEYLYSNPSTAVPTALAHSKANNWLFENVRPVAYPTLLTGALTVASGMMGNNAPPSLDAEGNYTVDEEAWRRALGLKTEPKYILESQYKPSNAEDPNAKYYTISPSVLDRQKLIQEAKDRNMQVGDKAYMESLSPYIVDGFMSQNEFSEIDPLQRFKMSVGEDDKGRYLSIYDKYDFSGPANEFIQPYEFYDRVYYKRGGKIPRYRRNLYR